MCACHRAVRVGKDCEAGPPRFPGGLYVELSRQLAEEIDESDGGQRGGPEAVGCGRQ